MFTKLTQAVLAKNGEKLRSALLVPQAVYTLGLANSEGAPLVQLLPANCLIEVAGVCEQVDKARQDKAIAAVEAKLATGSERALVRDLKVWWRQAASHVELSQVAGAEVPAEVIQVRRSQALSALLEETSKTLGLLDKLSQYRRRHDPGAHRRRAEAVPGPAASRGRARAGARQ